MFICVGEDVVVEHLFEEWFVPVVPCENAVDMVVVGFVEAWVVVGVVCDVDGVGDAVCAPVFDLDAWVVGVFVDVLFEFVSVVYCEFESCCELWHRLCWLFCVGVFSGFGLFGS